MGEYKNELCLNELFLVTYSLIPRPFPPPVFDSLQYTNTEGEGLGDLVMYGDVR